MTAHEDGEFEDRFGVPPYPAPGRPEQPMPRKPSPWPWIAGVSAIFSLLYLAMLVGYLLVASV